MKRKAPAAAARVYRLRLELQYLRPAIWREIEVLSSMSLAALHGAIQILMGWEDYHLWAIEAGERRFEPPHADAGAFGGKADDPGTASVGEVLPDSKSHLLYNYDFGDDWLVTVTVVSILTQEARVRFPRCVAGERAGPLEDSGGPPGYEHMLVVRKKPRSREAKELLEWAGEDWDPDRFDIDAVNKRLASLARPRRVH